MLSIIGGSGLYELDGLEIIKEHELSTPFGKPSSLVTEGDYQGQKIFFLSRHGKGHKLLPHEVNYRANVYALKSLGATKILSISASGSLREKLKPGELALVSQYFDHTRGKRDYSFFGDGIAAHVSTAEPACPSLTKDLLNAAKKIGQPLHQNATYGCVEGPRLGTKAESFFLRDSAKCDLVGMTNVPEAFLAREAQMAYCTLSIITDYDCWMEDPTQHVSVEKFFETYGLALEKAKAIIFELIKNPLNPSTDKIRKSLEMSILTPESALDEKQKAWLKVLRA